MKTSWNSLTIAGRCIACVGALLLAGCASRTLQYPPFPVQTKRVEDPTKARIYLVRPVQALGAGSALTIRFSATGSVATGPKVDRYHRMVGEVTAGRYLCWEQPPSTLEIQRIERNADSIASLDLVAGNVYYLRASTLMGWRSPKSHIEIITEEEGLSLLKRCKPPNDYERRSQ